MLFPTDPTLHMSGKALIFCAPSGSGKSTLIHFLMGYASLNLHFSVSATNRPPRAGEQDGVDYHFLSPDAFRQHIADNDFIEYEEVYEGRFYGTLKSEVEGRLAKGENLVFDVDVHGAVRLKQYFGQRALSLFIHPGTIDVLRQRLEQRGTESPATIAQRLERAAYEFTFASRCDRVILNDQLERAEQETLTIVTDFLS